MLRYAKLYEEHVNNLYFNLVDNEKYKYFHLGYFDTPKLETDEWNKISRVSLYEGNIIAYMQANISRTNILVSSLLCMSVASTYKAYKTFEKDLLSFVLILLNKYPTIQWSVVIGNPVQKKYRKFVEAVGGNIVGTWHKSARIGNELLDEECYELISSPEVIAKVERLIARL